jgi:uncharacterized protein YodC (DUF2158 family)
MKSEMTVKDLKINERYLIKETGHGGEDYLRVYSAKVLDMSNTYVQLYFEEGKYTDWIDKERFVGNTFNSSHKWVILERIEKPITLEEIKQWENSRHMEKEDYIPKFAKGEMVCHVTNKTIPMLVVIQAYWPNDTCKCRWIDKNGQYQEIGFSESELFPYAEEKTALNS